jgi:hypothetical protein
MQNIAGFDFFPLQYDGNGNLSNPPQFDELVQAAATATDVILLAHGFCNDVHDATGLYTRFLTSMHTQLARPEFAALAARKFLAAGVFWPSKAFPDSFPTDGGGVASIGNKTAQAETVCATLRELETDATEEQKAALEEATYLVFRMEHDTDAQNRFAKLLLSTIPVRNDSDDEMEGLELMRTKSGAEMLTMLRHPLVIPVKRPSSGGGAAGGVAAVSTKVRVIHPGGVEGLATPFGSILGAAGKLANLTTWYQMKSRSGVVGETGVARAVRALKAALPSLKVHLVGHSLGGRLMAACARGLSQDPIVHPDSMTLLEAAFSHYGFSPNNGLGQSGFFRDALGKRVVSGPLLETFSAQDTVVGYAYAIASRLAADNTKAIGAASDPFGGIGRNGAQKTPESLVERLHEVGAPYSFKTGVVTNLDGSGGLITSHGDVTNDRVTYAAASALATT